MSTTRKTTDQFTSSSKYHVLEEALVKYTKIVEQGATRSRNLTKTKITAKAASTAIHSLSALFAAVTISTPEAGAVMPPLVLAVSILGIAFSAQSTIAQALSKEDTPKKRLERDKLTLRALEGEKNLFNGKAGKYANLNSEDRQVQLVTAVNAILNNAVRQDNTPSTSNDNSLQPQ